MGRRARLSADCSTPFFPNELKGHHVLGERRYLSNERECFSGTYLCCIRSPRGPLIVTEQGPGGGIRDSLHVRRCREDEGTSHVHRPHESRSPNAGFGMTTPCGATGIPHRNSYRKSEREKTPHNSEFVAIALDGDRNKGFGNPDHSVSKLPICQVADGRTCIYSALYDLHEIS